MMKLFCEYGPKKTNHSIHSSYFYVYFLLKSKKKNTDTKNKPQSNLSSEIERERESESEEIENVWKVIITNIIYSEYVNNDVYLKCI